MTCANCTLSSDFSNITAIIVFKYHHARQPVALDDANTSEDQILNAYGVIGMTCSIFLCIFVCLWHKQRQIVVRFSTTLSSEIKRRSTLASMPRPLKAKRMNPKSKVGNTPNEKSNIITIIGLGEADDVAQDIELPGRILPSQSRSARHLSLSQSQNGSTALNLEQDVHQLSSRSSERPHRNTLSVSVSQTPLRSQSFSKRMFNDMTSTIGRAVEYFRPSDSVTTPNSPEGKHPGRYSDREVRRASIIANKRHLGNLSTSRSKSDGAIKALHEIHPKAASSANVHKFVQKSLQDCTLYE